MKNAILISLFCLATVLSVNAQQETLFNKSPLGLSGIFGGSTHNYTYVNDDWARIRGGYFGVEFGQTLQIGAAHYRLREDVEIAGTNSDYRMRFSGLMLGLTPDSRKVVHPKIGFVTGGGRLTIDDFDTSNDNIYVVQPSAGLEINVVKWFHLGLEGGYRWVTGVDVPGLDNSDVSAPFAQIDLRFGIFWGRRR